MRKNGAENCHDANLVRDGGAAAAPPLANAGAARRGSLAGDGERLPLPALHPTLRPHAAADAAAAAAANTDDAAAAAGRPSSCVSQTSARVGCPLKPASYPLSVRSG